VLKAEAAAQSGSWEEDIRRFLRGRLAGYKVPKRFVFLEELPKSGPGKILKAELAKRFGGRNA
jgi:fatty-acyl-CoA synthase